MSREGILIANKSIQEALRYTSSSILSYPDGTHIIENGAVEFSPRLQTSELIISIESNLSKYKEYWLKNVAFIRSGGLSSGQIPPFECFWQKGGRNGDLQPKSFLHERGKRDNWLA